MRTRRRSSLLAASFALSFVVSFGVPFARSPASPFSVAAADAASLRVRVTLDPSLPVARGRLIVLATSQREPQRHPRWELGDSRQAMAGAEVERLLPGATVDVDVDTHAFPGPLSQLGPGTWQMMALLDVDHSYGVHLGEDAGDLYGPVVSVVVPAACAQLTVELRIDRQVFESPPATLPRVERVVFESPLLTAFFGRPATMRAVVLLPRPRARALRDGGKDERLATFYQVTGYGGIPDKRLGGFLALEDRTPGPPLVRVILDGTAPNGHTGYTDSVNCGPWARALVEELVPYLERRFGLSSSPSRRFLGGQSSGGWASLWLQLTYPDFFGGVWATAPDPVDLRHFMGDTDVTLGSHENLFHTREGRARPVMRSGGQVVFTVEDMVRIEQVWGDRAGPLRTFDWQWGPRAVDGSAQRLFDPATGELDPVAQRAWQAHDIRRILDERWSELAPRLVGKLHVYVGSDDSFYLDVPTRSLCELLRERKLEGAECEVVSGKDHFTLMEGESAGDLPSRIWTAAKARIR